MEYLVPFSDIEVTPKGMVATSDHPWLELKFGRGVPAGRWVRIAYRASLLDHLVRPLIRYETPEGDEWDVMSATLFGRADWIGRVPDEAIRVFISPVDRPGRFGFELEFVETVSRLSLLPRAFRHDRKTASMALGARLIDARQEARQALNFARGGVAMKDYARWRHERFRPFEPCGLDAPRRPADELPHIRFILGRQETPLTMDAPRIASLLASRAGGWSIAAHVQDLDEEARRVLTLQFCALDASSPVEGLADRDLIACLHPDISLADCALPVLCETAAREPSAFCFYGDEDHRGAAGSVEAPLLKPDWSPEFEASLPYLGRAVFWRVEKVRQVCATTDAEFGSANWRQRALEGASALEVHHIRRILATGPTPQRPEVSAQAPCDPPTVSVSIIIPTKNQLGLLRECLDGLRFRTQHPIQEVLIVDNGSERSVLDYYATLAEDPRIKIMHRPGPFNFSAMCNAAAAVAQGRCLVFLNNDISVVEPDWLGGLAALAIRSDVGAVGARLLFPGGAIQHAGVVVGMGGYADHVNHGAPRDCGGYLGRLGVTHEIVAVTGACIAVEARKFHAVNGFDAESYPVELNDIHLCLRLSRAGWRTLMHPRALLIHHQSASRGFSFRPFRRYEKERKRFRSMWRQVIRDDPYFHPALSLFSPETALDG